MQAGSERVALTGATGTVLQQSIGINKSLFVLRKVIKALSKLAAASASSSSSTARGAAAAAAGANKLKSVVPYRDSALTRLLKDSLGGSCLTLMIACLSPSDVYAEENLSTLNYAGLTKQISNNASINEDPKTALIRKLRAEVKMLRALLARANQTFSLGSGGGGGGVAQNKQLLAIQQSSNNSNKSPGGGHNRSRSHIGSGAQVALSPPLYPSDELAGNSNSNSNLGEKLVDSVNIIKELIGDNNDLRILYQENAAQLEGLEVGDTHAR